MNKQLEAELESKIRTATNLLSSDRGLAYIYGSNSELLKKRTDYWQSVLVQAEESLYNLRTGDTKCPPTGCGE